MKKIDEPEQSKFGIASFVLVVVSVAIIIGSYSITGTLARSVRATMKMYQIILCIVAFVLGTVGMFSKNKKYGFGIFGSIASLALLTADLFFI